MLFPMLSESFKKLFGWIQKASSKSFLGGLVHLWERYDMEELAEIILPYVKVCVKSLHVWDAASFPFCLSLLHPSCVILKGPLSHRLWAEATSCSRRGKDPFWKFIIFAKGFTHWADSLFSYNDILSQHGGQNVFSHKACWLPLD